MNLLRYLQKNLEDRRLSSIVRLSPALPSLAQALVEMFLHLQWRSAAIIGTGEARSCLYIYYQSNVVFKVTYIFSQ